MVQGGKCRGEVAPAMEGDWRWLEADESQRCRWKERRGEKIGWEMRDCAQAKSRPAGPACCLRDCKLSLRMQTDMRDRHHLPVLPSTTESTAPLLPVSSQRRIQAPLASPLCCSRRLHPATSCLSFGLLSVYKMSQLAAELHRRCQPIGVEWFIGSL